MSHPKPRTRSRTCRPVSRLRRTQPGVVLVAITSIVVVAMGFVAHVGFVQLQQQQARAALLERLRLAAGDPTGTAIDLFGATIDDPLLPEPLRAAADSGMRASYIGPADPRTLWGAQRLDDRIVSITADLSAQHELITTVDTALVAAGGALIVIAAALGALTQRLTGRLRAQIDLERRVAADIAHELRTPLTGLVTAAELLPPSRPTEIVRERVASLRTLVEDVLEVSALADRATDRDVAVASLTQSVRAVVDGMPDRGDDIALVIDRDAMVHVDPLRLERIVTNAVSNARAHGRPPIHIAVSGTRLVISDRGSGFSDEMLKSGPIRFASGRARSVGTHGLGLSIITGHVERMGGTVSLRNATTGGAIVHIEFVAAQTSSRDSAELRD